MPSTSPRAQTSGPQTQRKRPGDLTGVNSQKLAAERDEAQAAAAAEAAALKQAERAEKVSTVIDYTQGGITPEVVEVDTPDEPHPATMRIRVNYPIEQMTFGREVLQEPVFNDEGVCTRPAILGRLNVYEFEEGAQYDVPWELGMHLKRLGYVYDF
jgi:hypothetical protein